jgi:hypothetical protein
MNDMTELLREILGLPIVTEDEIASLNTVLEASGEDFTAWATEHQEQVKAAYVTLDKQGFTASALGDEEVAQQISVVMSILAVYARRIGFGPLEGSHSGTIPDEALEYMDPMVVT